MEQRKDKVIYYIKAIFAQNNKSNKKIKILGTTFIKNNKIKCKIIYKNKFCELKEYLEDVDINYNHKDINKIKLTFFNNIIDISYIFYKCDSLISLSDSKTKYNTKMIKSGNIIKFNTKNQKLKMENIIQRINKNENSFVQIYISNMKYMLYGCHNLYDLFDISNFDISYVTDMSHIFGLCESLASLPDISKWNTSNVTKMKSLFNGCQSLTSLPKISEWNISKVNNISYMFCECNLLISLPDISKWNTNKVNDMSYIFSGCNSLISLPDISKWNTSKVKLMNNIFFGCCLLKSLPDISEWNTSNATNMSYMFCECNSLISLPDISNWDTSNVKFMNSMFYECSSLKSFPNLIEWDIFKVIEMKDIFEGCKPFLKLPNFLMWNIQNDFFKNEEYKFYEVIYKPDKNNKERVRILNVYFAIKNNNYCKIIYKNKIYEMTEYFENIDANYNHKDTITFILSVNIKCIDFSYMFHECKSLVSISDISQKDIPINISGNSNIVIIQLKKK